MVESKNTNARPRHLIRAVVSSSEINRTTRHFLANSRQIGRLESENKTLSKSLENTGGDKQQLQEMQAMVMKMAAAKAEPASGGKRGFRNGLRSPDPVVAGGFRPCTSACFLPLHSVLSSSTPVYFL